MPRPDIDTVFIALTLQSQRDADFYVYRRQLSQGRKSAPRNELSFSVAWLVPATAHAMKVGLSMYM